MSAEDLAERAGEVLASAARSVADGDIERRSRDLAEALAIYRQLGDRKSEAEVLIHLGNTARNVADHLGALVLPQRRNSLTACGSIGPRPGSSPSVT